MNQAITRGYQAQRSGVHQFTAVISAADLAAGNNLCNAASVSGGFSCPGLDQIGNIKRNTALGSELLQQPTCPSSRTCRSMSE